MSPSARPATVAAVLAQSDTREGRTTLVAWTQDEQLAAPLRVAALRRLEEVDAPETVTAAAGLVASLVPMLRQNALAVLARSHEPAAAAVVAELDPAARDFVRAVQESVR